MAIDCESQYLIWILEMKPYTCSTDCTVDMEGSGLITFQEDRFDISQWDISF